ncbi:hypothetical protein AMJ49_05655 [Parcubacteria bacterium DG_74_2]|nr:MAG: hypothetical protein AMJ49_05655 [Parcubacteria bacterium DG_74_2]
MEEQNINLEPAQKTSPWITTIVAVLVTLLAIGVLAWQYQRIEEKTEKTEEEIVELKDAIEQQSAMDLLERFMDVRLEKNEAQALTYFTERAMEQYYQDEFVLMDNFESFEVLKTEKLEETKFRFTTKIKTKDEMNYFVELITVIKILDSYYIDSIETAG